MKLSIITTCKGRIHHLKQTLPRMMFQWDVKPNSYEVVVVDYGDPDNSYTWAYREAQKMKFKNLIAVKVFNNIKLWNPGRARNIGARQSSGDILFFVDADIKLGKTDVRTVVDVFERENCVIWRRDIFAGAKGDTNGTFACTRESFFIVNGFNEIGTGWCLEDIDLFRRYECFRRSSIIKDGDLKISVIRHGRDLRTKYSGYENTKANRDDGVRKFQNTMNNVNPKGWGNGKIKVLRNADIS